jgi:AraC-like DNA-binding protein
MRTTLLEIANSDPRRRGPPLGRLWPTVTVCGPAQTPALLGVNSCSDQDLVLVESVLRSRLECLNLGARGSDRLAYVCIYMADQPTWLERASGCVEEIAAYEIAILDSEAPLRTLSTSGTRHLSLFVPRPTVLARMPWAAEICARSLQLDSDTRTTAHSLLATLRTSMAFDHFAAVAPSLVQALLTLLCTVGTSAPPPKPRLVAAIRHEQVTDSIKRGFSNPEFTVTAIAQELKVSVRYLQRICEAGPSPGEQLREFRLRRAAERLRSSSWKQRSISEVCFACGFGSSSHFSTEFRRFYGVTPREYRS